MQLLNTLLIGITAGSIYALMAIAFVLVWRSTRVVNFAQAGMALLSTYFGYEAVSRIGSFWVALPVAMIGGALFAALVELVLMRLLVKHASSGPIAGVAPIIATLGLLGVIRSVISMIWGGQDLRIVAPISNNGFTINGSTLVFSPLKLLILVVVAILLVLLTILFQKTNLGLALRASAHAPEIARLSGIRVDAVRTLGWAIAGAAGGLAGMLYVPGSYLHPNAMDVLLVFGFIAAVIGGLDSLFGAVAGAMILGFAINFATSYISYKLVFLTAFALLITVLLVKPSGIFSSSKGRKD